MKIPLNMAIAKSPINWVKVWLMAFTAFVAFNFILEGFSAKPEQE